jgi:ribosomal protein S12 methylthiotransferase
MYPENISDEFLEFFASEPKLVKYLDVPVQHASDRLLEKMSRKVTKDQLRSIFGRIRARVPDVSIRTSVMVGFPGETEEEFQELKDFVREMRFRHLGCFTYSQEEGTVAGRMPDQIDEETKQRRQREIMEVQREVSRESLKSFVGKVLPVLVEGPSEEIDLLWQGRLSTQAPEVDGLVYLNDGPVKAGEIQLVEIAETHDYDLVGAVVTQS